MADTPERTLVLDHEQVQRKLQRIAHQLHEQHFAEKAITLVGVAPRGALLADRLADLLERISEIKVHRAQLRMDKDDPLGGTIVLEGDSAAVKKGTVVLVDDVLMSGRTLIYAAAHLLGNSVRKLNTVVLVDRRHRTFPIRADIVGLTLSTTLKEHISVELGKKDAVYLS